MGMFDSVMVACPKCGQEVEFQSKVGACTCAVYEYNNVPKSIALALTGTFEKCTCGTDVYLYYDGREKKVPMRVSIRRPFMGLDDMDY